MSSFHPESCCIGAAANLTCSLLSLPSYQKDIYPPEYHNTPAIVFFVKSILFFLFILLAIRNIITALIKRAHIEIWNPLVMNTLLLLVIVFRFVYALDGPIQLFSNSLGFSVKMDFVLQIFSVCFLNLNFSFASYVWIQLILTCKQKWGNNKLTDIINKLFVFDFIFILAVTIFIMFELTTTFKSGEKIVPIFYSISSLVNVVLFAISCYHMGIYLEQIYEFYLIKTNKIKLLRIFAIVIGILSLIRSVNDFYSYIFPAWQLDLNLESYCARNFVWSAYLIIFTLFADTFPILLFLIVFAPENKEKKKKNHSFVGRLSASFGDMVFEMSRSMSKESTNNNFEAQFV